MRKLQRKTDDQRARLLLKEAPEHVLATTTPSGEPVLRVLNGVLLRDWILFHGALVGEKSECMGQRAVVSAHRVVADIPSHFVDEHKACPATTFYHSVQVSGVLHDINDIGLKAEMFQTLMDKLQPEGGFCPFASHEELYRKDLRAVKVFGLKIETLSGKASVGQDRPAERTSKVVAGLWKRGEPRDLPAIEDILEFSPDARPGAWKREDGAVLRVHPSSELVHQHALLLKDTYWRQGIGLDKVEAAISASAAWVGVVDPDGALLGAVRAASDRHWVAQISDVVVRDGYRGMGLGHQLMMILLDHPWVRHCPHQRLGTRERTTFYRALGFVEGPERPHAFRSVQMVRSP